ncbi:MAG TPA: helix-turn-helix transcriptional regulator [Allosphingosinicella sp.]
MTDPLPDRLIEQLHAGAFPVTVWRKHRGLSERELASRAEMPPSELRRIEESRRLRDEQAKRLAAALGVTPACLAPLRGRFRGCEDALAGLD